MWWCYVQFESWTRAVEVEVGGVGGWKREVEDWGGDCWLYGTYCGAWEEVEGDWDGWSWYWEGDSEGGGFGGYYRANSTFLWLYSWERLWYGWSYCRNGTTKSNRPQPHPHDQTLARSPSNDPGPALRHHRHHEHHINIQGRGKLQKSSRLVWGPSRRRKCRKDAN